MFNIIAKLYSVGFWIKTKIKLVLAILGIGTMVIVASITILNVHSHPQTGDYWTVSFETTGLRDLIITPDTQASIDDLDFISLKCGDEIRTPQILEGDVIFYPNWFCSEEGEIVHLVNITRNHYLKFQFGNKIEYAYNASTKYEYYDTGDDNGTGLYAANWGGQTFTPSTAHTITSVKLKLYQFGSIGTVTVGIRATSADDPTGSDLCSGTTDGSTLTTDTGGEWREITLGAGYALNASTQYAIVVRLDGGNGSNMLAWRYSSSGSYAGGMWTSSADSGSNWSSNSNKDYMFEDWGEPPAARRIIMPQ